MHLLQAHTQLCASLPGASLLALFLPLSPHLRALPSCRLQPTHPELSALATCNQVRELLGRSALYDWRRRPLAEADLLAAQKRLHAFAAVLLLEQPGSSMELLWCRFGWRHTDWEGQRAGSQHGSDAQAELAGQPAVLELMRQRNRLDERLYAYAAALHAAQLQQAGRS